MAKKRYTKVEEEIIQILNEADREPAWRRLRPRIRRPRRGPRPPRRFKLDATWLWYGGSFGLALLAVIVAGWSATLALILAILSIVAFLSPIVLQYTRPRAGPPVHQWRGRDIDLPPRRAGLIGEVRYRLWQWLNRQ